jgi:hypothetical protein
LISVLYFDKRPCSLNNYFSAKFFSCLIFWTFRCLDEVAKPNSFIQSGWVSNFAWEPLFYGSIKQVYKNTPEFGRWSVWSLEQLPHSVFNPNKTHFISIQFFKKSILIFFAFPPGSTLKIIKYELYFSSHQLSPWLVFFNLSLSWPWHSSRLSHTKWMTKQFWWVEVSPCS